MGSGSLKALAEHPSHGNPKGKREGLPFRGLTKKIEKKSATTGEISSNVNRKGEHSVRTERAGEGKKKTDLSPKDLFLLSKKKKILLHKGNFRPMKKETSRKREVWRRLSDHPGRVVRPSP